MNLTPQQETEFYFYALIILITAIWFYLEAKIPPKDDE